MWRHMVGERNINDEFRMSHSWRRGNWRRIGDT
jgi:hypothetical protein